jgi:signal transduction histidine kinase
MGNLDNREKLWEVLQVVLSSFLFIFSIFMFNIIKKSDLTITLEITTWLYIFLAGFVLVILKRADLLIGKLKEEQITYLDLNHKLEYETKQKTIELEKKILDLEKTRSAMINILEDVNEQKEQLMTSEFNMRKITKTLASNNKKLLSLDKQKDQFTSIASHELKTPLASIKGFVQLLLNKKVFANKEKREKYMSIILHDTTRLSKLITDMLDISRLDLGTLKLYFDEINIKEFVDNIGKEMTPMIQDKKLKFKSEINKDVPEILNSDKDRLAQVITNLINNAIHYTEEHGKISLLVKKEKRYVVFQVQDTGIGIPQNQQKQIFKRFYQVDSWLTRKIGGSGLGLAISKGIVDSLQGKIVIDSIVGKGTTFNIKLPIKLKKADNKNGLVNLVNPSKN